MCSLIKRFFVCHMRRGDIIQSPGKEDEHGDEDQIRTHPIFIYVSCLITEFLSRDLKTIPKLAVLIVPVSLSLSWFVLTLLFL